MVTGESVARLHQMVVCKMTLVVRKRRKAKAEKEEQKLEAEKEDWCDNFRKRCGPV